MTEKQTREIRDLMGKFQRCFASKFTRQLDLADALGPRGSQILEKLFTKLDDYLTREESSNG